MKNWFKKSLLILPLLLVLVLTGCLNVTDKTGNSPNQNSNTNTTIKKSEDTPASSELSVTLKIADKSFPLKVKKGTTGFEMMEMAKKDGKIEYKATKYEGMGYSIDEINGQASNSKENMYWSFYLNNKLAPVGISDYKLKDGDVIEWRFEKAVF